MNTKSQLFISWSGALVMLVCIAALAGCASAPKRGILGPDAVVPAGESVVFGEIRTEGQLPKRPYISVIDLRTSVPVLQQPLAEGDTPFFWHLPPGRYAAFELGTGHRSDFGCEMTSGRIYAEFGVPSAGLVVYAGCLKLTVRSNDIEAAVSDAFENAKNSLKTTRPRVLGETVKGLFKPENKR